MDQDAQATAARIRQQIELLEARQRSDPMETEYDAAIEALERQLREGEWI